MRKKNTPLRTGDGDRGGEDFSEETDEGERGGEGDFFLLGVGVAFFIGVDYSCA